LARTSGNQEQYKSAEILWEMGTPNDAISAAIAATNSHEQDASKRERPSSASSSPGRRRSISGSLSSSNWSPEHSSRTPECPSPINEELPSPRSGGAVAMAIQQRKARSRKGSLRKSAILGTSKLRMDGKERRSSSGLEEVQTVDKGQDHESGPGLGTLSAPISPVTPVDLLTPRPLPVPPPVPMVTHPVHGDPSKILEVTEAKEPFPDLKRPFTAQSSTASTTDDDDSLTSATDFLSPKLSSLPLPSDSYFPPQPPRLPRTTQSSPKTHSPLATLPPSIPSSPPSEWDYSETRWWGWIILCVTWIVFVVGMGSCFGVWSWAWDVGETPYAPPELEDDPTLPIVGYYPALIVLTCVMAWVWVTVAWVGMKYFKHANISGDED
ncbi:MAG: hypothetical protein Q9217_007058, partial [Psora testacea]